MNPCSFTDATRSYREAAGDDFRQPDPHLSRRTGKLWRLKDSRGKPVAIVSDTGRVLRNGSELTTRRI